MDAATQPHIDRAAERLLRDCEAVGRFVDVHVPSPYQRLEDALGSDLARLLLTALARGQRAHPGRLLASDVGEPMVPPRAPPSQIAAVTGRRLGLSGE